MNLSGIRISAGFYDYNSIENQTVTVGSELPAELPQSVTDQALEQYQFFVGTNPDEVQPVRPDENFIL